MANGNVLHDLLDKARNQQQKSVLLAAKMQLAEGGQQPNGNSGLLNSWKEIANYMGRGVRTVQRWEGIGLPVRRPRGKDRSAVFALREDIDNWVQRAPMRGLQNPPMTSGVQSTRLHATQIQSCSNRLSSAAARVVTTSSELLVGIDRAIRLCEKIQARRATWSGATDGSLVDQPPLA